MEKVKVDYAMSIQSTCIPIVNVHSYPVVVLLGSSLQQVVASENCCKICHLCPGDSIEGSLLRLPGLRILFGKNP